jgi:hypothetical protein
MDLRARHHLSTRVIRYHKENKTVIRHDSRKDPHPQPYISLWLKDYHAEYSLTPQPTPSAKVIYNPYDLEDLFGEKKLIGLAKLLPQEFTDGETHIYIWEVSGKIDQLEGMFNWFVAEVMIGPYDCGDDTYYDYWPSAFDICEQWAADLDKLTETTTHLDFLKQAYNKMVEDKGEVEEFQPGWEITA